MANARRDTPDRIKRMRELAASGASTREIGVELGVTHTTIARWLESDAKLKGATAPKPAPVSPAASVARLLEEPETDAPLDVIRRRRQQIRTALDENFDATTTGAFPMALYEKLAKLETYYLSEEARHTPPPPPDPDQDPNNKDAIERVANLLGALVDQAERDVRCQHCGAHPFG